MAEALDPYAWPVQLEHFQGPLGLLVLLLSRRELNPDDVSLGQIAQILTNTWHRESLNLRAELWLAFATLVALKAKGLLPESAAPEFVWEQPSELQPAWVGAACRALLRSAQQAATYLPRPVLTPGVYGTPGDLLRALAAARRRRQGRVKPAVYTLGTTAVRWQSRLQPLRAALAALGRVQLWPAVLPDADLVSDLLAALELCRVGEATLEQEEPFADLRMVRAQ